MNTTKIMDYADKHNLYLDISHDYAEPGYSKDNEDEPIFLANWNEFPDKLSDCLENSGNIEWSDEWTSCYDCQKIFRISGDSYSWTQYGSCDDDGYTCGDCIKEYPDEYLNDLINNPNKCDLIGLNLENCGFEEIDKEYESGWYNTCDNPKEIMDKALQEFPEYEFIFGNISAEQFRTNFNLYRRIIDTEK